MFVVVGVLLVVMELVEGRWVVWGLYIICSKFCGGGM